MVADDENLVAIGISSALTALGYEVVGPIGDGQAAIDCARVEHPDLAILDIRMPIVDGLACAAQLWRELEIPAIIVSAYSSPNYVEQAQAAGVYGYLLKPVTTESLRAAVSIAWSRAVTVLWQAKRIDQLEQTLAVRRTVEMAKWRIIESCSMPEPEAHALLQKAARNQRRRLIDIAQEVLADPSHPLRQRT